VTQKQVSYWKIDTEFPRENGEYMISMTQQELEKLLKESEQIASDWNAFLQFREKRETVLEEFMAVEGLN